MQLFILSASRETALALASAVQTRLADEGLSVAVFDALAWADDAFAATNEGAPIYRLLEREYAANRQRFIRQRLAQDPYQGLARYALWCEEAGNPEHIIVVRPSTPDEFIALLQEDDHNAVLHITGQTSESAYPDALAEGQLWIEQYLAWRQRLGSPLPVFTGEPAELEAALLESEALFQA